MQAAAGALVLALGFTVDAAETAGSESAAAVVVEDSRPVGKAVAMLVAQQGFKITYEDPSFAYSDDITQRTESEGRKARAPKGGRLLLAMPAARQTEQDLTGILSKLLEANAALNRGGRFRLRQSGDEFHIIPSEVKDTNGQWIEQASVLDAKISLPAERRVGLQILETFCETLSKATNKRIVVGTFPANAVLPYDGALNAEEEEARSVLRRVLDATNRRLTWQLLYDPQTRWHFLNVVRVPDRPAEVSSEKPKAPAATTNGAGGTAALAVPHRPECRSAMHNVRATRQSTCETSSRNWECFRSRGRSPLPGSTRRRPTTLPRASRRAGGASG